MNVKTDLGPTQIGGLITGNGHTETVETERIGGAAFVSHAASATGSWTVAAVTGWQAYPPRRRIEARPVSLLF